MQPATSQARPTDKRGAAATPLATHDSATGAPGAIDGPSTPPAARNPAPVPGAPAITSRSHRTCLELQAHPRAVPHARRFARETLRAWKLHRIADDTELIISELVSNAVTAAGLLPDAHISVLIAARPDHLAVLVWDASPRLPARQPHDDDAASGRGLQIVEALSARWGSYADRHGKVVWAQLRLDIP
jgi:anti-sigma regulatory factor (Ser/Thr protein kinase)